MGDYGIDTGDKIIIVIGPTGVGKSTFIDYVIVGEHISRDSRASTTGITVRKTDLGTPPQSFAFVDTPGFDNATNVGHILWFIKRAKKLGLQLDRTLYLHPVLEDPKSPSPEEKLHLTSSLYRTQLPEATFVEITWSLKRDIIGPRRVRDHLKGKGCDTVQFGNSIVSAHRIVLSLEESSTTTPLENPVSPSSNVQDMSTQLQDGTRQPQISAIDPPGESQNQIQGAQAIDTRKTTATSAGDVKSTEDRSSKPADTLDPFSTNIRDDTARNNQEVKAANQIQDITRGEDLRATDARKVYFTNTKDVEIMNEQDAKLADAGYMFVTNIQDDTARSNQEFKAANQTQDTTKEEDVRPTNTRKESVTKPNDVDIINDQSAKRANTRDPAATNTEGDEARNNLVAKSAMKTRIPKATQGKGPQVAERRDMSVTIQPTTPITVPEANIASLEDIPPTDKVFLIMGPDGSGKSTFIDYASGGDGKVSASTAASAMSSTPINSNRKPITPRLLTSARIMLPSALALMPVNMRIRPPQNSIIPTTSNTTSHILVSSTKLSSTNRGLPRATNSYPGIPTIFSPTDTATTLNDMRTWLQASLVVIVVSLSPNPTILPAMNNAMVQMPVIMLRQANHYLMLPKTPTLVNTIRFKLASHMVLLSELLAMVPHSLDP
ncbi:hypothetical protein FRC18_005069 [Serendipita sp. 400]|nr:hypothetical protein FRC18_005069 [Serendipita sp. 400]